MDNSARRGGINGYDDTFAFLSARQNDKCANLRTQTGPFAFLSAHSRRFGAHLETQTISGGVGSIGGDSRGRGEEYQG